MARTRSSASVWVVEMWHPIKREWVPVFSRGAFITRAAAELDYKTSPVGDIVYRVRRYDRPERKGA